MIRRWQCWVAGALLLAGCGGDPPGRLVLLLTVDTLRADALGAYGSEHGATPHLDALALESTFFTRAYAPSAFTLPSIAGLLTGHYPEALGIETNESGLPDQVPTLATELGASGWEGAAVVGNFVLRRESGVARGFRRFDDEFPSREGVRHWPERDAAHTTDAALEMLDGCTQLPSTRCFLWVHYQDPHGPYEPPEGWREQHLADERRAPDGSLRLAAGEDHLGRGAIPSYQYLSGESEVAWYRAGYRGEISYMDEQIGRLISELRERELWADAVVVFAADHGEALGDHGIWFAHGAGLTDDQVRVPLLFRAPGVESGPRNDVATLLDVFPTLLGLVGLDVQPGARSGRDLFASAASTENSVAYMTTLRALPENQFALVDDGFKFIAVERDGAFDGRLFTLGSESADLAAAAPQVAARMRGRLAALRKSILPLAEPSAPGLGPEDRQRLEALGYAETKPAAGPAPEAAATERP